MTTDLHLRGVVLPGETARDVFVRSGTLSFDSDGDAETVFSDGYLVPGLVDAHAHLPFNSPAAKGASTEERARASALLHLDTGVLVIRDPGAPTPPALDTDPDLPRILTAGRFLAAPGRMFPEHGQIELTDTEIAEAAEGQLELSGSWVKLIGDFPVRDEGFQTSFLPETIAEVCRRVHALGGRVAIHAVHRSTIQDAIDAGVDSIEHGLMASADQLDEMAKRGIALTPTMVSTGAWLPGVLHQMGAPPEKVAEVADAVEHHPAAVRTAMEAGVTLLAGTDAGLVSHGLVPEEIRRLMGTGMNPREALGAGSWTARSFLGLAGTDEGAPADIVGYARNPLEDPAVLDEPAVIILDGRLKFLRES